MAGVAVNGSCHGQIVNGLILDGADVTRVVCVWPLQEVVEALQDGQAVEIVNTQLDR